MRVIGDEVREQERGALAVAKTAELRPIVGLVADGRCETTELESLVAQAPPAGVTNTQTIVSQRILSRGCMNCHQTIHGSNSPSGVAFGR